MGEILIRTIERILRRREKGGLSKIQTKNSNWPISTHAVAGRGALSKMRLVFVDSRFAPTCVGDVTRVSGGLLVLARFTPTEDGYSFLRLTQYDIILLKLALYRPVMWKRV